MADPLPHQLLRGIYAIIVRNGKPSPSLYDVKNYLNVNHKNVYVPPTAAELKAIETELKKGPFPTTDMVQFGFGYWYNYFFKELPDARKVEFAVHVVQPDGSFRDENTPPAKPWKDIFNEMLKLGFKEFKSKDKLTAAEALQHAAQDHKNNFLQSRSVSVVFRGDGRLPKTIQEQGGTARQSRVAALRSSRNMDKPWHPFNEQGHKVWVRNGANADNCLFSAVSITPQFNVASKFPLLDDLRGSNPGAIGHSVVMIRPRVVAPAVVGRLPKVGQRYQQATQQGAELERRVLLASQTNIYCVCLRDVYNTQNYQGGDTFPEYATTRISWMDHLVWFAVTRIHFSEVDGNAGHLIVITDHQYLQDETIARNVILKGVGFDVLKSFVTNMVNRGSVKNGVGGIVYTPPGIEAEFDIVAIRELFIPGRPAQAAQAPATAAPQPQRQVGKVVIPQAFTKPN